MASRNTPNDSRPSDRSQAGRHVPARPGLLQLLHRPDDDEREVRCAVWRAGAQAGPDADAVHMDIAASIQAVTEEIVLRLARSIARRNRNEESLPGRRRRAQLRRQWQDPARRQSSRTSGSSRRPATQAARSARRWRPIIIHQRRGRARSSNELDGMQGAYLGPAFDAEQIESELRAAGAHVHDLLRRGR